MTMNTQTLPSSQALCTKQRKPCSEIERLGSRRTAIGFEMCDLQDAQAKLPESGDLRRKIDARLDDLTNQDAALIDRLIGMTPSTVAESKIVASALELKLEFLQSDLETITEEFPNFNELPWRMSSVTKRLLKRAGIQATEPLAMAV